MSHRRPPSSFVLALAVLGAAALSLSGCAPRRVEPPPSAPLEPVLTEADVQGLFPSSVRERQAWTTDVVDALQSQGLPVTASNVCAVLAVIAQESGFQPNPVVPDLALIVRRRLEAYESKLGPLGKPALHALLEGRTPGVPGTFEQRLARVRTEYDVDRLFRDLLADYQHRHPLAYGAAQLADALFTSGHLEDLNPVTTAGSMQVSVRFATELAQKQRMDPASVRDALYTRHGGVHFGVARLLGYPARYDRELYRFADYNAGVYASRNAALQRELTRLTGLRLTPDGDLLAYDRAGKPSDHDSESLRALLAFRGEYAPELSERTLREDVLQEKDATFEATRTYAALRAAAAREEGGAEPAYAVLPEVVISGPKMKHERSTAWYAQSVERHFEACLARVPSGRRVAMPPELVPQR